MVNLATQMQFSQSTHDGQAEIIAQLRQTIGGGKHWYLALLEAIGGWALPQEIYNGRHYCYLIAGEAFDFLLLAERLCGAVDGLLPYDEMTALLFQGCPPLQLAEREFKELIGVRKYRQHLNYFYGVTAEEALFLAVQDDVRKERRVVGFGNNEHDIVNQVYRRIYGAAKEVLLKRFRKERGYPHLKSTTLAELREFTYWLFKYRLRQCEKARIASDTRKALNWLSQEGFPEGLLTRPTGK